MIWVTFDWSTYCLVSHDRIDQQDNNYEDDDPEDHLGDWELFHINSVEEFECNVPDFFKAEQAEQYGQADHHYDEIVHES